MKTETLLATLGCNPDDHRGAINTPVYRASTILFPTLAAFETAENNTCPYPTYGRYGTISTNTLEESLAVLDGADHAIVTSSGLSAIVLALTTFLKNGDHLLMVDTTYGCTRRFCDNELKGMGVETTYYDPMIGAGIAALMKPNTKVVYVESPGSITFEVQDIPAIAKAAHAKGAVVMSDSTWGTPLYFRPYDLGVDISIHSATKYIGGHSDLVMGVVTCKKEHYPQLWKTFRNTGPCPSGDNCFLAQRGLRSMGARLAQHYENGVAVAKWLKARPEVETVLHPALPDCPGHELWKRDFKGACGLFSFILKEQPGVKAMTAMMDNLELFGMGYSWGGYESLLIPISPHKIRTATKWNHKGQGLRIHVGLEHPDDLIRDLEAGFERLQKAA